MAFEVVIGLLVGACVTGSLLGERVGVDDGLDVGAFEGCCCYDVRRKSV